MPCGFVHEAFFVDVRQVCKKTLIFQGADLSLPLGKPIRLPFTIQQVPWKG